MNEGTPPYRRTPSLWQAMVPVFLLMGLLSTSVYLFGDESSSGPNQIALILGAGLCIVIGLYNGQSWKDLEIGITSGL